MENYKTKYLSNFKKYLLDTIGMATSTSNDYVKRIITICDEENVLVENINSYIEKWKEEYTTGSKKEQGSRSHNSYRSALLKYYEYYISLTNKTQNNKYEITLQRQGIGFGTAVLKNPSGEILSTEIILKGKNQDIKRIVWNMLYDMLDDKDCAFDFGSIVDQLNVSVRNLDKEKI